MTDAPTQNQSESQTQSQPASAAGPAHRYNAALARTIEPKWQELWLAQGTDRALNPGDAGFDASKPKFYAMDMFPYPSAAGLHVGHPEGYIATDIISRFKRMTGHNVLHPMGWDAFGLPAEQYAIKTGVHPEVTTREAIDNFRRQLRSFGFSYDWEREFATIDPEYYRWTQWIWLQMYDSWFDPQSNAARPVADLRAALDADEARPGPGGAVIRSDNRHWAGSRKWSALDQAEQRTFIDDQRLAYLGEQTVNWCPKLGTVLANEEVIDGRSERGGFPVVRRPLRQWMFRITAYAGRLLDGLDELDWPTSTKTMQREWIGRSEGAHADFACGKRRIRVFTTRPDTLFGATYMVLAPEHPLVDELAGESFGETVPASWRAQGFPGAAELVEKNAAPREVIEAYRAHVAGKSDVDRQESREKSGVFIGSYAINPASEERIPVFIADYVMMGYGTGAIMAVPAHDTRDFEFAELFGLPIKDVIYNRTHAAIAHFFAHMDEATAGDPTELGHPRWKVALADMLGIVTSTTLNIDSFDVAFERCLQERPAEEMPDSVPASGEGVLGAQKGLVQAQWLETIEGMRIDDFAACREMLAGAGLHKHLGQAYTGPGSAVHSGPIDGLAQAEAKARVTQLLEDRKLGSGTIQYRLRDWLFSRQRYWGEPFPVVFDEAGNHHGVGADTLPVELPVLEDYTPAENDEPTPLLGKAEGWVRTTAGEAGVEGLPADAPVTRETNTMPGWAGSCWYYLRYMDPKFAGGPVSAEAERYWMGENGVDLYIGGAEHAVLHLLYARFWHMVLFDLGVVSTPEPFRRLFHQGLITSFAYQRPDKSLVPIDEVEEQAEGRFVETATGEACAQVIAKMSKSLKNVVNPDDVIERYGADTFRLYEMYMGPLDQSKPWNTDDIMGMHRFLQRVWRLVVDEETGELKLKPDADNAVEKLLHRTIAKVEGDIDRLAFNTAIAAMIEFVNASSKAGGLTRDQTHRFVRTIAPFVPHAAQELWQKMGEASMVALAEWPAHDPAMLRDDEVEIPVQIMGKVRARITVAAGSDPKAIEDAAMADDKVRQLIEGKTVRKVVVVPGKMVNIVAN